MRIIGLVEADFNKALTILFTRQLMWSAEKTGITPNQWGGRPNRSAPDCASRKLLTLEYKRYMRQPVALFFSDLASCFDRMMVSLSSIVSLKKGMDRNVCECRAKVMRQMKRHVRTGAGTSNTTYQQEEGEVPLEGEIQGKGDVMGLWALQSDSILNVHEKTSPLIRLEHVTKETASIRNADCYVDDADIYVAEEKPYCPDENYYGILDENEEFEDETEDPGDLGDDPIETAKHLQESAQNWTDLVGLTGGQMAFHKCFWQIMTFKPASGSMLMRSSTSIDYDMKLQNRNGQESNIKLKPVNEPNKGLGFLLAPTGTQTPEYNSRLQQMRDIASKIKHSFLRRHEAYLAYITRVIPSVTYPFALTSFTVAQCKKLSATIEQVILPKMGINRNFPKAALYGPHELGGMAFPTIETIQDQKCITHWLKHLRWGGR